MFREALAAISDQYDLWIDGGDRPSGNDERLAVVGPVTDRLRPRRWRLHGERRARPPLRPRGRRRPDLHKRVLRRRERDALRRLQGEWHRPGERRPGHRQLHADQERLCEHRAAL